MKVMRAQNLNPNNSTPEINKQAAASHRSQNINGASLRAPALENEQIDRATLPVDERNSILIICKICTNTT